ncbi:MAG: helix-turn-helix transcriptional regulator [Syntrophorhabdaceae bacterium]|nr:helix-turn-helix transcriptional regulator [Syntrophorhabdaceae bacterium]
MSRKKSRPYDITQFGERIRYIRDSLYLTQDRFAEILGISRPYVSELEKGKYVPSDQLTLSISRAFNVLPGWLRTGEGEKFDRIDDTVFPVIGEICKVIEQRNGPLSLYTYALLTGVDVNHLYDEKKRMERFPSIHADDMFRALVEILKEGNNVKVGAVRAFLFSMMPPRGEGTTIYNNEDWAREDALSRIRWAKRLAATGDINDAIKEYHYELGLLSRFELANSREEIYRLVKDEYRESIRRNEKYNNALETLITTVKAKPGIREASLHRHSKLSPKDMHYVQLAAEDLGCIRRMVKGKTSVFFPT